MTAPVPEPPPVVIEPAPGSRLDQLAAAYPDAKANADAAKSHLDTIVTAIKSELAMSAPGATRVDLDSPNLDAPLRLAAKTSWGLDTPRLKAEAPELYVRYAKQRTVWELRAVSDRPRPS